MNSLEVLASGKECIYTPLHSLKKPLARSGLKLIRYNYPADVLHTISQKGTRRYHQYH